MNIVRIINTFKNIYLRLVFYHHIIIIFFFRLMLSFYIEIIFFIFFNILYFGLWIFWHEFFIIDAVEVTFTFILLDHYLRQFICSSIFTF